MNISKYLMKMIQASQQERELHTIFHRPSVLYRLRKQDGERDWVKEIQHADVSNEEDLQKRELRERLKLRTALAENEDDERDPQRLVRPVEQAARSADSECYRRSNQLFRSKEIC